MRHSASLSPLVTAITVKSPLCQAKQPLHVHAAVAGAVAVTPLQPYLCVKQKPQGLIADGGSSGCACTAQAQRMVLTASPCHCVCALADCRACHHCRAQAGVSGRALEATQGGMSRPQDCSYVMWRLGS